MRSASFYKWRAKFGGMDSSLIGEMKDLAEQNRRLKKRLRRDRPEPLAVPERPNETWSMGFMADQVADSRSIRTLNVLDGFNREDLAKAGGIAVQNMSLLETGQVKGVRFETLAIYMRN